MPNQDLSRGARYRKIFGGLRQRLDTPQGLKGAMRQLTNDALAQLAEHGLIAFDLQQTGEAIKPMEPGRIMCRFYLRFETRRHRPWPRRMAAGRPKTTREKGPDP